LNDLRSVFRRAISDNYLRESPFKGWEEPDVPDVGLTRYLSPKEEKRLRNALADRDDHARRQRRSANDWRGQRDIELLREWSERDFTDHLWPMVLVSLNSGLRYGELAQLEWSAVDLRARNMTITWKTAKGKKTRHIPLNREAMDVLTRWKKQNDGVGLVFKNLDGSRIKSVKTAWGAVLAEATIEDFRWHDLRHTFASNLVQRGVDLVVVRDLLGHASIAQTMRYAHLRPGQTAAAVARLAA
jgi:integrase